MSFIIIIIISLLNIGFVLLNWYCQHMNWHTPLLPLPWKTGYVIVILSGKDWIKHWIKNGVPMSENWDGACNSSQKAAKLQLVKDHIYTCRSSHYACREAPGRNYLPADLNSSTVKMMSTSQTLWMISYSCMIWIRHSDILQKMCAAPMLNLAWNWRSQKSQVRSNAKNGHCTSYTDEEHVNSMIC